MGAVEEAVVWEIGVVGGGNEGLANDVDGLGVVGGNGATSPDCRKGVGVARRLGGGDVLGGGGGGGAISGVPVDFGVGAGGTIVVEAS